ncbi:MAG: hypothetical protein J6X92_04605, partial [Bacteroidales bacterium]|nr:hypothetical protein [Bacteroidales bacterium]
EAIKILKTERYCQEDTPNLKRVRKAYDMAIEALKIDRPGGEWERDKTYTDLIFCSKCGMPYEEKLTPKYFCPNCGVKMDGERSEE